MDTMFWTRVVGGVCGALLIFLMINWGAEELYHVGGHDKGHGEEHGDDHGDDHGEKTDALAWIIVEDGEDEDVEVVEVSFEEIYAAADASKGQGVFRKCSSCHSLEAGKNGTGPYLAGVFGRPIGAADGYGYSGAMAGFGGEWTAEALYRFIENPGSYIDGTKMKFKLDKSTDRADVVAYLESLGG